MLSYLSFKDEIIQGYEDGNYHSLFVRQNADHDIQKVIFDKSYLKFLNQRQRNQDNVIVTTGYVSVHENKRQMSP